MDILDKINGKLYSYDELRDMEIVLEMSMLIQEDDLMNEAFDLSLLKTGGKALMKGLGLHASKSGDGLIQMALKSGKLMAEFVWHILKAAAGNKDSKIRVKEIANTQISKEDFMNFLLKLDMATLHMVTGPLHMLDAITGWHIGVHIKSKVGDIMIKAKEAINNLVDAAKGTDTSIRKKLKSLMHGIARLFGLDDEQSTIKSL